MEQHQLTEGPLLDSKGNLWEAGFAYSLVKDYERKAIKARKSRIKEWDYYYFGNHEIGIALTIDDNSYMDLCSVTFFDYRKKQYWEKSRMHFLTFGKHDFPATSKTGDVSYRDKKVDITFENRNGKRHLFGIFHSFREKENLRFDLRVAETRKDTMVIATPFFKEKHFYYNQKINNLMANGIVTIGKESYEIKDFPGVFDWGRGVWTRINTWYWASMNDIVEGHNIGFNLGYGFGDTSKASENMFFLDEKGYKLDDILFAIPKDNQEKEDYSKPWHMVSQDKSIDLVFTPIIHRKGGGNAVFVHSIQNQLFGFYEGTIKINNTIFPIHHCYGFAEKVYNRW